MAQTTARKVTLQFDRSLDLLPTGKRLSEGMSAVTAIGDSLFLTHDETVSIERLGVERRGTRAFAFARHRRFMLDQFISLPATADRRIRADALEGDLEAMSFCGRYLWVAGSHSALRGGMEGRTTEERIATLADVRRSGNRFLLARIPIAVEYDGATPVRALHADDGSTLCAARLAGGRKHDALTRALRDDPHLGPFLSIPSKDNGFDIEGLAAAPDGRVWLGLRGPVIDGWACIVEIRPVEHRRRADELVLGRVERGRGASRGRQLYRKHFVDLDGGGIRDLCFSGRDLLILSGPPMRGKGASRVRVWKNALSVKRETIVRGEQMPTLLELPYREKKNHAEGIAVLGRKRANVALLVVYDSAERDPRVPPAAMTAVLHSLTMPDARD